MANAKNVSMLVQIRSGSTQYVSVYRNPPANLSDERSEAYTVVKHFTQLYVSKQSMDGNYYYSPKYNGWISAKNIKIVEEASADSPLDNNSSMLPEWWGETEDDTSHILEEMNATPTTATISGTIQGQRTYAAYTGATVGNSYSDNLLAEFDTVGAGPVHREGSSIVQDVILPTDRGAYSDGSPFSDVRFNGVFGMPYQFSAMIDRRTNGVGMEDYGVGHKYADKIVARSNLLYLTPGLQRFMPGASGADRAGVINALVDGLTIDSIASNIENDQRYYTMEFAIDDYFRYVNAMCHGVARLLGIQNVTVQMADRRLRIRDINWASVRDSSFHRYFFSQNNIVYYVDGLNSVSEDFGNDTRESSLVSSVNGLSDQAKEINYITNSNIADSDLAEGASAAFSQLQSLVDSMTSGKGVLQGILGNTSTLMSGGKLVFPELWGDSSFDRSYSISLKFISPEADPVSIYLNVMVPYIHLIAMTAPHDYDNGNNGYVAPFLVRAFFKGMFNIDMGIITSLSSEKGGEGSWSLDGLPTQLTVNMSIKDLYKSMYVTPISGLDFGGAWKLLANDGQMDYMMNMAAVDMTEPLAGKKLALWGSLIGSTVTGWPGSISNKVRNDLSRALYRILG